MGSLGLYFIYTVIVLGFKASAHSLELSHGGANTLMGVNFSKLSYDSKEMQKRNGSLSSKICKIWVSNHLAWSTNVTQ